MAEIPERSFTRTEKFNWYEIAIRYCYYTARHGGWGVFGFLGTIGFLLLLLPFGLYYKITGKPTPDLELL